MRISIGITGLIVVAVMLAMVPTASAGASTWVGNATYSTTGEWVPDGWTIKMENLNESYVTEPWFDDTHQYFMWNAHCDGQTTLGDNTWIYVNVTSPEGDWYGEFTCRLGDMDKAFLKYVHHVTVYPVAPPTETYTKDLVAGWNLVSLPLTSADNSTSAVLGSITGNYDAVVRYDAATHSFVALSSSDTTENGVGYFIHMTAADTWSYDGTAYTDMTAQLEQGLNMVGWTNTSADLPGALDSIAGNYRYAARWNATAQSYEVFVAGAPSVFNDFDTMERGEGYFIAATTSCTLTYP